MVGGVNDLRTCDPCEYLSFFPPFNTPTISGELPQGTPTKEQMRERALIRLIMKCRVPFKLNKVSLISLSLSLSFSFDMRPSLFQKLITQQGEDEEGNGLPHPHVEDSLNPTLRFASPTIIRVCPERYSHALNPPRFPGRWTETQGRCTTGTEGIGKGEKKARFPCLCFVFVWLFFVHNRRLLYVVVMVVVE